METYAKRKRPAGRHDPEGMYHCFARKPTKRLTHAIATLSFEDVLVLRNWYKAHEQFPYPTDAEKAELVRSTSQ